MAGNLRQTAESGWTAADHMARAVALARGWPYDTRGKFLEVMCNAAAQTGDDRINVLTKQAYTLRVDSESQDGLDQDSVREQLRGVGELLDRLELMITGGHIPG